MPHQGRNVKRIREILGIKQDALAIDLGLSQQAISQLEQRETLDAPTLEKIAKVLGVSEEAIKNFNDEAVFNIISSSFDNGAVGINYYPTFHPVEKIIQLHEEKIALYERMLKEKDEMMAKLEGLLNKK